jgi:hypothetical protein
MQVRIRVALSRASPLGKQPGWAQTVSSGDTRRSVPWEYGRRKSRDKEGHNYWKVRRWEMWWQMLQRSWTDLHPKAQDRRKNSHAGRVGSVFRRSCQTSAEQDEGTSTDNPEEAQSFLLRALSTGPAGGQGERTRETEPRWGEMSLLGLGVQ